VIGGGGVLVAAALVIAVALTAHVRTLAADNAKLRLSLASQAQAGARTAEIAQELNATLASATESAKANPAAAASSRASIAAYQANWAHVSKAVDNIFMRSRSA